MVILGGDRWSCGVNNCRSFGRCTFYLRFLFYGRTHCKPMTEHLTDNLSHGDDDDQSLREATTAETNCACKKTKFCISF